MAFSTQKDFFHVPFMNESVEYDCCKASVKLKSYDSTMDDRAWALDNRKQSKFLSDLVACETVVGESCGDGEAMLNNQSAISHMGPVGGDSLLECATTHLAEYQKVLNINSQLEKKLETSEQSLRTAKEENRKIKEILTAKLDHNIAKDFLNKVEQLRLPKNEENELLQMYKKMEDLIKAYEVLQAENNYVKRLVEKLSTRTSINEIPTEPEVSTDIVYLQEQVNKLRRECTMLRKVEDDFQKLKQNTQQNMSAQKRLSDQDAENIRAIVKERNSLREKCKSFKALEKRVGDLQQKEKHLNDNLNNQSKYINNMESEIQKMQKYYEDQHQDACFTQECLKAQLEEMKEELIQAKCQAQKAEMLQMEISCLRNEILKRDMALANYDCQYKQLMQVVDELQSCCVRGRTVDTDDLVFFAQATLDHIRKELSNRDSQDKILRFRESREELLPTDAKKTQSQIKDYGKEEHKDYGIDEPKAGDIANDDLCADALDRIKKLEELNNRLKKDLDDAKAENDRLQKNLKDCNTKMEQMLDKLNKLEDELKENAKDAKEIGKDLKTTKDLVKDISDMQIKNQQVTSALKAIKSQDDEKLIDDLRKKLEDALNQLKKCQQDNDKLQKDLDEKEKQLKDLNDLNNKLKAEKDKLLTDMEKLKEERDKLAADKAKLESERNKLADDMERLKKELDKLLDDKKKLEDENNKLAADLKKMEEERNNLLNDIKKLEDEKNKLAADLKKMEEERNNLLNNIKKLEDEKNKLAADLKKMEEEKNNLLNNIKKLEDEKNKLAADLKKMEEERNNLLNNIKKLEDEKNKLAADLKKTDDEKKTLEDEKKKLSTDLKIMEDDKKKLGDESNKLDADKTKNKLASDLKKFDDETGKLPVVHDKMGEGPTSVAPTEAVRHKKKLIIPKEEDIEIFVQKSTEKFNLKGRCLEKELRKILDEFIEECSFCFCRLTNPKSKLYTICHKTFHYGIQTLSFRELAYLHRKIFKQCEFLLPGFLLNMILTDNAEQARDMLITDVTNAGEKQYEQSITDKGEGDSQEQLKCCSCKSELCCYTSEESLKQKVFKLERDIEHAKEYLCSLKTTVHSPRVKRSLPNDASIDTQLTHRASKSRRDQAKMVKQLRAQLK